MIAQKLQLLFVQKNKDAIASLHHSLFYCLRNFNKSFIDILRAIALQHK